MASSSQKKLWWVVVLAVVVLAALALRKWHRSPDHGLRGPRDEGLLFGRQKDPGPTARGQAPSPMTPARFAPPKARLRRGLAWLAGSREPSAAAVIPGHKAILVLDDEPKASGPNGGIFVYRVSKAGRLRHLPLRLRRQKRRWDDWEGLAATPSYAVLMTSHGKRNKKRAQVCRFPWSRLKLSARSAKLDATLECWGGKRQRKRIKALLKRASRRIGFSLPHRWKKRNPKAGGLDLEAMVYHASQKRFYIGLRGPLARYRGKQWGIALAMDWGQGAPRFRYAGLVDASNKGLRALTPMPGGGFLLSAGPVGSAGGFGLYRIADFPASQLGRFLLRPKAWAPGASLSKLLRPEGMAFFGGALYLFSDTGDWRRSQPAMVQRIPWKRKKKGGR